MPTKTVPFSDQEWKIPGYTGYVQGLQETYKKTPIMAQLETREPTADSFIYTRTLAEPKSSPVRDPCNYPENFRKSEPDNLWPTLQDKAKQDSAKPPKSNIALGDERTSPFTTSYSTDFHAPFDAHARLRSPMRNKDIAHTETGLREHYRSSFNRVTEKRLQKMISTMSERLSAKLGNSNDNAFKMRRLFKMYDKEGNGLIHFEDFRMATESFGMQLDDDSLLALYYVYDPAGSGYLAYEDIVKQLLDKDYFAMYLPEKVDNTEATVEGQNKHKLVESMRRKIKVFADEMREVFAAFDPENTGSINTKDFMAACASLGVVLRGAELDYVLEVTRKGNTDSINYVEFCDVFAPQIQL